MIEIARISLPTFSVSVVADPSLEGGEFYVPEYGVPVIRIGPGESIEDCLNYLMHEAQELYCFTHGIRFKSSASACGSDDHLFVMDHVQFTRMVHVGATVVAHCMDCISTDHSDWIKQAYNAGHPCQVNLDESRPVPCPGDEASTP